MRGADALCRRARLYAALRRFMPDAAPRGFSLLFAMFYALAFAAIIISRVFHALRVLMMPP